MLFFDAHLDMAWNALEFNRNLMLSAAEIRESEKHYAGIVSGPNTVSWTELKRGRIGTIITTLLSRLHRKDRALTFYQSDEAAYGASMGQLAYYKGMCRRGTLREITDKAILNSHIAAWESSSDDTKLPIGYILSMEGAYGVLGAEQIHEWHAAGLRILGPAHYGPNRYCYGTGSEGGFTDEGRQLLKEMRKAGVILDVTHLADQSLWEALELYDGPVLASHHNSRTLVPGDRQLTDEMIKALAARGAVIGASFDSWMIVPGWKIGVTDPATCRLEHLANHTDHICQLLGTTKHCGLGTDLDGGFGKEQSPSDLETIAELHKFTDILRDRGYSEADVTGIAYRNWIEFFRRAWS